VETTVGDVVSTVGRLEGDGLGIGLGEEEGTTTTHTLNPGLVIEWSDTHVIEEFSSTATLLGPPKPLKVSPLTVRRS
jgi:hypothetical protein